MASIEHQLEVLHSFLAQWPCPTGTRVSDHVRHEAGAGNVAAQRLLQSDLFTDGAGGDAEAQEPSGPLVPPAVQERERRLAAQQPGERGGPLREAARPIVHSSESRPWLE